MSVPSISAILRNQPKGARFASFGLGFAVFALLPTEIAYQDIASLLARQPEVAARWQKRVASAATGVQVATFSFGRPMGTLAPQTASSQLASRDRQAPGSRNPLMQPPRRYDASEFPVVDRALKGDRLIATRSAPVGPSSVPDAFDTNSSVRGAKTADRLDQPLDPELAAALAAPPLDVTPADPIDPPSADTLARSLSVAGAPTSNTRDKFAVSVASLFFDGGSMASTYDPLERWQPGEEPAIVVAALGDPDIKITAALPPALETPAVGESVASKGEVNSVNQRARTPAERLKLFDPKARAKQEKCLADAVYFEARGERVRGQIAVAQVVMNRAFSGYYPATPCGVVYQNSHRRLACQFTFACDGKRDVVTDQDMWDRARKIAKETLDGRLWLPEVGRSTHYHAAYVHPRWVREMRKNARFGLHTFYRPRKWGDGSDAPKWGTPEATAEIAAKLAEVKP